MLPASMKLLPNYDNPLRDPAGVFCPWKCLQEAARDHENQAACEAKFPRHWG